MTLREFDVNYKQFLDRSTIVYGETGSGKSSVIVDILYNLSQHIDQIVVISPTDRQNHTYDNGIVPLPFIHYAITPTLLDDIWDRQNALAAVYTRANNSKIIQQLFNKIRDITGANDVIKDIDKKFKLYEQEIRSGNTDSNIIDIKISNMTKEYKKLIEVVYKKYIVKNHAILSNLPLTEDERFTLKYIAINPRMVIIFDDCTNQLKKFKSHAVMQKLFYQGRWAFITMLIACHTDKALDPELKKNAFISIFTGEKSANSYFERKTNDFDKEDKMRAATARKLAFTPLAKYQKLIWVREENEFYKYTAKLHTGFRFGSPIIWDYCDRIKLKAGTINMDNKFINKFI